MNYQLNPIVTIVPPTYVSAVLKLHQKFEGKSITWALSGDFGEALKGVRVEPDCVEIVTSKEGAEKIQDSVKDLNPQSIEHRVQQLPRNAVVGGSEYPLYEGSYYFEFFVDAIKVKVHGDLQYKVGEWSWGDKFEFSPSEVYIVNKKTSVVPLHIKYELYQNLGWSDRAEKIANAYIRESFRQKFFSQ
jgi:hypothetical protein